MAEENEHIVYELIAKYFAGETTAEEESRIMLWRKASESNDHAFAKMKILWEQAGKIAPHKTAAVDVDKGWQKFKTRIESTDKVLEHPETASKDRSLYHYISRVAAVLVIGVGLYWAFQKLQPSKENIVLISADEVLNDTLPDGSAIALNTKSQLSFPEKFGNKQRNVSLKGEGFFHVKHNPQKPFTVAVRGALITVLGTSFYVQAYDSLERITVGVKEGAVKVATRHAEATLKAGESVMIDNVSKEIQTVGAFDPNALYWETNALIFQNEKLSTVFQTLEKHYAVNIVAENPKLLNCRLTAKFYSESIDQIFEIINTNFNLSSTNKGHLFIVSGNGCE